MIDQDPPSEKAKRRHLRLVKNEDRVSGVPDRTDRLAPREPEKPQRNLNPSEQTPEEKHPLPPDRREP